LGGFREEVPAYVRADGEPLGTDGRRLPDGGPVRGSPVIGREALVVVVPEEIAVELVATGLGDDVDHAAQRPPVLGLVAAELDLDLLDELVVEGLALVAQLDAGRVDAVDDVLVLERRGAVDRDAAGLVRAGSRRASR